MAFLIPGAAILTDIQYLEGPDASMATSLYIHIPFCRKRCFYCDFTSAPYDRQKASRYVRVIADQVGSLEGRFDTIYVGGGTPTVLEKDLLVPVLKSLKERSGERVEYTVEANPESLTEERIRILLENGVNRISIGLQSLNGRKLQSLGRAHDLKNGIEAVAMAHRNGFKNIGVDLIYGVWGESLESWREELEGVKDLPVRHVSCYALTYEKGTPLFEAVRDGAIKPADDETVASMYEEAIERLSVRGFKQYEVSNFAQEGYECRHNLNYWRNDPYIGIGVSAVSYDGGVRATNVADIDEYIRRADEGSSSVDSSEELTSIKRAKETAAVKIRTKEGIDLAWFKEKTGFDLLSLEAKALERLVNDDLVKYEKKDGVPVGISLRRRGFLFCDTVSAELL